jgi:hypothetical protein
MPMNSIHQISDEKRDGENRADEIHGPCYYFDSRVPRGRKGKTPQFELLLMPFNCYRIVAPIRKPRQLNILESAVLGLIRVGLRNPSISEVARYIDVNLHLAGRIVQDLMERNWVDENMRMTPQGKAMLEQDEEASSDLITGYIFQEPVSGDVMPHFVTSLGQPREYRGRRIELGTSKGEPDSKSAFMIYRRGFPVAKCPSGAAIADAVELSTRQNLRVERQQRRKHVDGPADSDRQLHHAISDHHLEKISIVDERPEKLWIATYVHAVESAPESQWAAVDPFGNFQYPWLKKRLEKIMELPQQKNLKERIDGLLEWLGKGKQDQLISLMVENETAESRLKDEYPAVANSENEGLKAAFINVLVIIDDAVSKKKTAYDPRNNARDCLEKVVECLLSDYSDSYMEKHQFLFELRDSGKGNFDDRAARDYTEQKMKKAGLFPTDSEIEEEKAKFTIRSNREKSIKHWKKDLLTYCKTRKETLRVLETNHSRRSLKINLVEQIKACMLAACNEEFHPLRIVAGKDSGFLMKLYCAHISSSVGSHSKAGPRSLTKGELEEAIQASRDAYKLCGEIVNCFEQSMTHGNASKEKSDG